MAALLEAALKQAIAPNYVRRRLSASGKAEDRAAVKHGL